MNNFVLSLGRFLGMTFLFVKCSELHFLIEISNLVSAVMEMEANFGLKNFISLLTS